VDYRVAGVQVHDARLVAAMLVHGIRNILTFKTQDFTRYSAITVVNPTKIRQHSASSYLEVVGRTVLRGWL